MILIICWIPVLLTNVGFLLTGYDFEYSLYLTILIIPVSFFLIIIAVGLISEIDTK